MTENPANATLVGKFLPQVPTHRGSVRVVYSNPRYPTVAAGVQLVGAQFDEDQNTADTPAAEVRGGRCRRLARVRPDFEIFMGVQNLFDAEYFVGTLPTTVGSPRLVSAGFRLRLDGALKSG